MSKRKSVFMEGGRPTKLVRVDQNVRGPLTANEQIRIADMKLMARGKRQQNELVQQQAARIISNARIGGFVGIEKKFIDQTYSGSIVAPTDCTGAEADPATNNCLNAVAQGDGESNRDGKEYIIKGITFEGTVTSGPNVDQTTVSSPFVTVAIILDTQTNGAQENSEDVYTNTAAAAAGNANLLRNLQYSKRFKVLKKWNFPLNVHSGVFDGVNQEVAQVSEKLSYYADKLDIKVQCTGTGATVASISTNSLHVVAFATGSGCVLKYNSRIRFFG